MLNKKLIIVFGIIMLLGSVIAIDSFIDGSIPIELNKVEPSIFDKIVLDRLDKYEIERDAYEILVYDKIEDNNLKIFPASNMNSKELGSFLIEIKLNNYCYDAVVLNGNGYLIPNKNGMYCSNEYLFENKVLELKK